MNDNKVIDPRLARTPQAHGGPAFGPLRNQHSEAPILPLQREGLQSEGERHDKLSVRLCATASAAKSEEVQHHFKVLRSLYQEMLPRLALVLLTLQDICPGTENNEIATGGNDLPTPTNQSV